MEETAELVSAAGGRGIAVRVDHGVEAEVKDLFQRAERELGRLDVLADSVAGQDMILAGWEPTWKTDLSNAELALRQGLLSHVYTAKYAATLMPGVPEVRFHAGALRGHRGELARGCQEGPELPGVRDAAVLRPGRGRWLPTPES
ncbi:MAG: SDR family oxidoreductase [Gemmatimonadetes bacterium]|nr:SDR family oxidoreductase [Gemmatimonadota bacterium]